MKTIYYTRVLLISPEFLVLMMSLCLFLLFETDLRLLFGDIKLNEKVIDWAALAPVAVLGWTISVAREVLFPNDVNQKALHEWPDFWMLKTHFNVGFLIAVCTAIACLVVALTSDLNSLDGLWLFSTFFITQLTNAGSFYLANIKIKSILIHLIGQSRQ